MKPVALTVLFVGSVTTAVVGQDPIQWTRIDHIVAVVGETPIARSKIDEQLNILRTQQGALPTDPEQLAQFERGILDRIIENELLMQAAERDTMVTVTDEQVQASVDERMRDFREQYASAALFLRAIRQAGFANEDDYRTFLSGQVRIELTRGTLEQYLRQSGQLEPIPPTEREMRAFFAENREQLGQRPPTVTFRQIVVRPQPDTSAVQRAFARADSALQRVNSGEDFGTVAQEMSDDEASAARGGELGWFRRGQMAPEFESAAFRMRPGNISPIVETQFGFHIIEVQRVDAAEVMARHILISPEITDRNQRDANVLADSLLALLRVGTDFDSLLEVHHDQDEEFLLDRIARDQLPPMYAQPMAAAQPGDLMGPVVLPGPGFQKYAIVQFQGALGEGEYTFDEVRDRLRSILGDQNGMNQYIADLRRATHVDIRL